MPREVLVGRCHECLEQDKNAPVLPIEQLHKTNNHFLLCEHHFRALEKIEK